MRILAELGFKSYIPSRGLEKGMLFTYKLHHGHKIKEQIGVRKLESVPMDQESFIRDNGYPVYPVLTIDDEIVAEEAEIGWFDAGPESEDLEDITIEQLNVIVDIYEGEVAIEADEETEEPLFMEGPDGIKKVIISYPEEWEEEDDDDDDDEDYDDNDDETDEDDDTWKEI
jgi:hypothetical protein